MSGTPALTVRIGIFIVIGLVILIGFSLRVESGGLSRDSYRVTAYFDDAQGLEQGADISLHGVRVGRVTNLDFDPSRKAVRATFTINGQYPIADDSIASVDRSALLGGALVVIRYGESARPIADGEELPTRAMTGLSELVDSVTRTSDDARGFIDSLKANQEEFFAEIRTVIEENSENLKSASAAFADAGPKFDALSEELLAVAQDFREGRGTLGRMFQDEEMYDDIKAFSTEARQIAEDIRSGEGTLSRLLYDDTIARNAEESFEKLGSAGAEIEALLADKRDDLEKLIEAMAAVGPKLEEAIATIQEIAAKVNSTDGTLGLLVNDPSLYEDARRTVTQIGESFEGGEEQGVIRSFVGILFGALI